MARDARETQIKDVMTKSPATLPPGQTAIEALRPRFEIYERASSVNERPWLVDLLVWSAKRSPRRLARMSGVLEETHAPTNLISARSFARLLFER